MGRKNLILPSWGFHQALWIILVVGLLHGLIYVFMIPPWWHHEEATHFEYAWLVAHNAHWPQPGEFNNDLHRQIGESMLSIGQENLVNLKPKDLQSNNIWIGLPQLEDPPIYPWLVSWPLRLLAKQNILVQLYVARMISLVLFLISIVFAWQLMGEVVKGNNPLRWMVPLFLAMLPGYVDEMVAVHNDVIGAVAASLFLWLSVRWIKKRFSFLLLAVWGASVVICFYSSVPAKLLVLAAPFVPLFWALGKRTVPVLGLVILCAALFGSFYALSFRDARNWFYTSSQTLSNRVKNPQAVDGQYVFSLIQSKQKSINFGQYFSATTMIPLRDRIVTLGVWIWAESPTNINTPTMMFRTPKKIQRSPKRKLSINETPTFYKFVFAVPEDASEGWLSIISKVSNNTEQIYYDGFILVDGDFSEYQTEPTFNLGGHTGEWGGKFITNLIRNPSAEKAQFSFKPFVDKFFKKMPDLKIQPSLMLTTLQDYNGFGWYYFQKLSLLFQEFWGRAAAAQVPLIGSYSYAALRGLVFLCILGLLYHLKFIRKLWIRNEIFFLVIIIFIIWVPTILKGYNTVFILRIVMSYARYAFPAFIPTALFFCAGFLYFLQWLSERLNLINNFPSLAFLAFLVGLDVYAIFSFGGYFYPRMLDFGYLLFLGLLMGGAFLLIRSVSSYLSHQE